MISCIVQKISSVRIFSQKKEKFFCSSSSLRIFSSLWTDDILRLKNLTLSALHTFFFFARLPLLRKKIKKIFCLHRSPHEKKKRLINLN